MKKKHYEVVVSAYATVLVKHAESEDQAMEIATNNLSVGSMQIDDASISREVKAKDLDSSARHADVICEDE